MKIPLTPPPFKQLTDDLAQKGRLADILSVDTSADYRGKYHHWDKLRHLRLPDGFNSHDEWWFAIKLARRSLYKRIPHKDKHGQNFVYGESDLVRKLLHEVDIHGGGEVKSNTQLANPSIKDTYLINSLIEEAITSSQLEGAATTRKIAKEMLRENRKPRDRSETMIVNNYHAMQFINEIDNEELTPELVLELHRILTEGTLDNHKSVGKLRTTDDVYVGDERDASIIHTPPKASELESRLKSVCEFANSVEPNAFLHPVVRAIILHFLLAYDHPFDDGNGRTARALFYWSMRKQDYWTMEYISISRILKTAPAKYMRAYLYTETDDGDVTYFIVHQLEVIKRAINELFQYLKRKENEIKEVENLVKRSPKLRELLNHRQVELINRALKKPESIFHIESHRGAHGVAYQTARTDLLELVDLGLLDKYKYGRRFIFSAPDHMKEKLEKLS